MATQTNDPFAALGFVEIRQPKPVKAAARAATVGAGGAYGDILDIAKLQSKQKLLPGERARLQAEHELPESMLPWLQEEDILPNYARLPSSEEIDVMLTKGGIPKQEETSSEKLAGRFGRFVGTGAALGAPQLLTSGTAALGGQAAEELGLGPMGQAVGEIAGALTPAGIKAGAAYLNSPKELTSSGLQKTRALKIPEEKLKKSYITKERQQLRLAELDKEASNFAKKSLEKAHPKIKEIEAGVDFPAQHREQFGKLQEMAQKANPEINISPVSTFMGEVREKYRGIPSLDAEAKKILSESRKFAKNPPTELHPLLKTYRHNNKKLSDIYENFRIHGAQNDYANFLLGQNREIANSIKQSLPENSQWVKLFEDSNRDFGDYMKALKSKGMLEHALQGKPSYLRFKNLAENAKSQKKLAVSMGKENADEMVTLAKDFVAARDALKSMKTKEFFNSTDALIGGTSFLTSLMGTPVGAISTIFKLSKIPKAYKFAKGYWYTMPSQRDAVKNALKAIKNNDISTYNASIKNIIDKFKSEGLNEEFTSYKVANQEDPFAALGFVEIKD